MLVYAYLGIEQTIETTVFFGVCFGKNRCDFMRDYAGTAAGMHSHIPNQL